MKLKNLIIALAIPFTLSACSSASAQSPHYHSANFKQNYGGWVLNPRKCPDLVEDWRDRRESRWDEAYDRNRRDVIEDRIDRRESRRDEAVTICPASAWEWQGGTYKKHYHPKRPAKVKVFYSHAKRHHYHNNRHTRVTIQW